MNNLEEMKNAGDNKDNRDNNSFRPHSINELYLLRKQFRDKLYLSERKAQHNRCGHRYFVKKNGKKEQGMLKHNTCGYCSVCWRLEKTNGHELEELFNNFSLYHDETETITFADYENEKKFYMWLYSK